MGSEALPRGLDLISGNTKPVESSEQENGSLRLVWSKVPGAVSQSAGAAITNT